MTFEFQLQSGSKFDITGNETGFSVGLLMTGYPSYTLLIQKQSNVFIYVGNTQTGLMDYSQVSWVDKRTLETKYRLPSAGWILAVVHLLRTGQINGFDRSSVKVESQRCEGSWKRASKRSASEPGEDVLPVERMWVSWSRESPQAIQGIHVEEVAGNAYTFVAHPVPWSSNFKHLSFDDMNRLIDSSYKISK
jgi:hypothetical protein